jgi:hypothetical protein
MIGLGGNSERGGLRPDLFTTPERDFAAFDELPPGLRQTIACLATTVSPERVLGQYRRALALAAANGWTRAIAESAVVMSCSQFEDLDIEAEAHRHLLRYGYQLPHVAAQASIQRGWGPPKGRRCPRIA